jgi:nucleoside-diphosphate-sugar epimerase
MSGDLVLVTGGTGVVGTSLIEELRGEERVACLVHSTPLEDETGTVEHVKGDLTEPDLGLDHGAWLELAKRVKAVVHCAAVVDLSAGKRLIHGLNVRGTEHILEFAAQADAPIYYTSSAFIARAEMLDDLEGAVAKNLREYFRTKNLAEDLVRMSGVPYTIIRPPLLFSDTRTGRITREQAIHRTLRGVVDGSLPFVPWAAKTRIDFIPQDHMGKAIASLVRHDGADGSEYWATAGQEAITAEELVEECVGAMKEEGVEIDPVPMFDVEMVKRLIVPAFLSEFKKKDQRRVYGLISLAAVFGNPEPLPCNWDEIPGQPHHTTRQELRDVVALTVKRTLSPTAEKAEAERLAKAG